MSTEENELDDIQGFFLDEIFRTEFVFKPITQEPFKPFKD